MLFGTLAIENDGYKILQDEESYKVFPLSISYDEGQVELSLTDNWYGLGEIDELVMKRTDQQFELKNLLPTIEKSEPWYTDTSVIEHVTKGMKVSDDIYDEKRTREELSEEEKIDLEYYENEEIQLPWETISGGCSWYCGAQIESINADSFLRSQKDNEYHSVAVHDASLLSAWVEGADGDGIGEGVEIVFSEDHVRVCNILVYNGYQKSKETYYDNSRPKKLKLFINGFEYGILNLEDTHEVQTFTIPFTTSKGERNPLVFRFEIMEVYKGNKFEDTAISEINFDGMGVHCLAEDTSITMADGTEKSIQAVSHGDLVMGYNLLSGLIEPVTVNNVYEISHKRFVEYEFAEQAVIATASHPFVGAKEKIDSSNPEETVGLYGIIDVNEIEVGSSLYMIENDKLRLATVKSIREIDEEKNAYAISLPDGYCYFGNGILSAGD